MSRNTQRCHNVAKGGKPRCLARFGADAHLGPHRERREGASVQKARCLAGPRLIADYHARSGLGRAGSRQTCEWIQFTARAGDIVLASHRACRLQGREARHSAEPIIAERAISQVRPPLA